MEIFGKRLRELRIERKLGQMDLAKVLGTSPQNISRWEKGYFEPDQNTLVALALYFKVSTDYLLGVEDA